MFLFNKHFEGRQWRSSIEDHLSAFIPVLKGRVFSELSDKSTDHKRSLLFEGTIHVMVYPECQPKQRDNI
jgi:hypothetical protein